MSARMRMKMSARFTFQLVIELELSLLGSFLTVDTLEVANSEGQGGDGENSCSKYQVAVKFIVGSCSEI